VVNERQNYIGLKSTIGVSLTRTWDFSTKKWTFSVVQMSILRETYTSNLTNGRNGPKNLKHLCSGISFASDKQRQKFLLLAAAPLTPSTTERKRTQRRPYFSLCNTNEEQKKHSMELAQYGLEQRSAPRWRSRRRTIYITRSTKTGANNDWCGTCPCICGV
jgi:hypothetical protein